jgi:[ribosomal protein S18]-alanine N-acetyltransferase
VDVEAHRARRPRLRRRPLHEASSGSTGSTAPNCGGRAQVGCPGFAIWTSSRPNPYDGSVVTSELSLGQDGLMEIRSLGPGDDAEVMAASALLDGPADAKATVRFLADPDHHLLVAYQEGRPVGFVSGVEMTHPDKGTEMFLYELAVDEDYQRLGIGRALVYQLVEVARRRGCYGLWVVTENSNDAAKATYQGTGGVPQADQLVFTWTFNDGPDGH